MAVQKFTSRGGIRVYGMPVETFPGHVNNIYLVVDGDTLLRIDFTPAPIVHDPDVAGTIYLDPKTYQLRITLLTLVNMNKALREQTAGQAIKAIFTEVIPGVPVVNAVSSAVFPIQDPKGPPREASTEFHRTLSVRFLKGKP